MPSKPLSVISLVLLIPVALLVLFAVRSLSLENDALNARRDRLAKQRMVTAAAHLNAKLEDLGRDVLTQTQTAYDTQGPEALTEGARKRRYIYAFVFKQGTVLHSVTALEHQYDRARGVQDSAQALAKTVTTPGQTEAALVQTGSDALLYERERRGGLCRHPQFGSFQCAAFGARCRRAHLGVNPGRAGGAQQNRD